ncbi:MAG: hypothetical protein WEC39_00200 [Patescibacteria group bacterium]
MKKIETVWHEILYQALQNKIYKHTQQDLAKKFSYSLGTIHHALKIPTQIGAIRKESKFFVLQDFGKLLYYWASLRNFKKDITYQTYFEGTATQIEGLATPSSIYAGYSAGRKILQEPPTDYERVYFYVNQKNLDEFKQRFPLSKAAKANIFALKMPPPMEQYGLVATLPQTFVDIWNLEDWYSRDFTKALEEKINGLLS